MLRNRRGAMSLRWLRALLDNGIEVHGQVVVCPGLNDAAVLYGTLAGVLDRFPELSTLAVVPLGVSRYSKEAAMRPHTTDEARATSRRSTSGRGCFAVPSAGGSCGPRTSTTCWQACSSPRRAPMRDLPSTRTASAWCARSRSRSTDPAEAGEPSAEGAALPARSGFFAWVEGAPAEGYRAPRTTAVKLGPRRASPKHLPVTILTAPYGEAVLAPLLNANGFGEVRILAVENEFFGGNIAVAGLMTGPDIARALGGDPAAGRYLLPDVCLSKGRFLDGSSLGELPVEVEVVPSDGASLRKVLEETR